MVSREQAEALANLIHVLRPEWDRAGIFSALGHCKDRNEFDVAMAAIRAAADPETRSPGRIPSGGDHWHERVAPVTAPRPPKPDDCCRTCGRAMHTPDVVCDQPTKRPPAPTEDPAAPVARLRALIGADNTNTDQGEHP